MKCTILISIILLFSPTSFGESDLLSVKERIKQRMRNAKRDSSKLEGIKKGYREKILKAPLGMTLKEFCRYTGNKEETFSPLPSFTDSEDDLMSLMAHQELTNTKYALKVREYEICIKKNPKDCGKLIDEMLLLYPYGRFKCKNKNEKVTVKCFSIPLDEHPDYDGGDTRLEIVPCFAKLKKYGKEPVLVGLCDIPRSPGNGFKFSKKKCKLRDISGKLVEPPIGPSCREVNERLIFK